MDKFKLKRMALLGISTGLTAFSPAYAEDSCVDLNSQCLLAKPACKGAHGCPGLTAFRDHPNNEDANEEEGIEDQETADLDDSKVKKGDDYKKGVHSKPVSPASPDSDSFRNSSPPKQGA
jgi:hypothetical protein